MSKFGLFVALLLSITVPPAYAQNDLSQVVVKTIQVTDSIYMLEGKGGNVVVSIGTDGVLMIDDQFAELHDRILTAIERLTSAPVKFVLNTHWHGDHTGGNEKMHEHGAYIVAQENVRKRLAEKQIRVLTGRVDQARPKEALPVLTYADGVTFHFNEDDIEAVYFGPGHTDGDSVIFFNKANVVHAGDHMFSGRFPFIDLDSGGDVQGYYQNVLAILNRIDDETKIIPGHGPLSTKVDMEQFRDMLAFYMEVVSQAVNENKSLEEIKLMAFPAQYYDWGSGFISNERWLETLFTYYTRQT